MESEWILIWTHVFLALLQLKADGLHSDFGGLQLVSGGQHDVALLQRSLLRILQLVHTEGSMFSVVFIKYFELRCRLTLTHQQIVNIHKNYQLWSDLLTNRCGTTSSWNRFRNNEWKCEIDRLQLWSHSHNAMLLPLNWRSSRSPPCIAASETRAPGEAAEWTERVYSQTPSVSLSPPPPGGCCDDCGSPGSPIKCGQKQHLIKKTKTKTLAQTWSCWSVFGLTCSLMFLWSSSCSLSVCTWFSMSTLLKISEPSWFLASDRTLSTWTHRNLLKHTTPRNTCS